MVNKKKIKDKILLIKEPGLEYFEDPDDILTLVKEVKTITPLTKAQAAYANTVEKTDLEQMSEDYANEVEKLREEGKKESEGKLFYELDWEFITFMAEVMAKNKGSKYPLFNWKNKIDIEGLRQALIRHTMAIAKDEFDDDGTELGHLASIALNSMMIWYQKKNYK